MNFFEFLRKYDFILVFVFFELFALFININRNQKSKAFFVNNANSFFSFINRNILFFNDYLYLKEQNKRLLEENRKLYSKIANLEEPIQDFVSYDVAKQKKWEYYGARIVNHQVVAQNNFFTIDKGKKHGIEPDMGVVAPGGIVGVVTNVSDNFAVVLSVFNTVTKISCKLYGTQVKGVLFWDGKIFNRFIVEQIPQHVKINIGDTIVTSSLSRFFPEDYLIGRIERFEKNQQDNFYTIYVKPFYYINELSEVYVVKNYELKEQKAIELNIK